MKTNTLQVDTILKGSEYEYRIEKVLGQGSFGITYLAETKVAVSGSLGKLNTFAKVKVAIKEFFLQEMNSRSEDGSLSYTDGNSLFQNYGKKFKKEALNLAKLSHPNIVNVLEYFEANNTFYYAMEFIEGSSLDDYIKRKGKLNEQEALKYLQQTASALEYMHSQKMLHLDLKPKNIMLNTNNDAVLIDFGLSKQYSENGEPESSTSIGLGTPGYAPIEQNTQNEKDFSPTIDVYSLGATLYKMLSGKTPPQASLVLNDGLDLSSIREKNVSEKTLSLLEKMMSPLKKNRPQNMTEVLNLLQTTSQTQHTEEDNTTINEEDTLVNKQKEETKKENTTVKERNTTIVSSKYKVVKLTPKTKENKSKKILFIILAVLVVLILTLIIVFSSGKTSSSDTSSISSTVSNTESVTEKVAENAEEIKDSTTNANTGGYSFPETQIDKDVYLVDTYYLTYFKANEYKLTQNQVSFIKKNCIRKGLMFYYITGYSCGSETCSLTLANKRVQEVIKVLLSGGVDRKYIIVESYDYCDSKSWKYRSVGIYMENPNKDIILNPTILPSFPGGKKALDEYLRKNIKKIPEPKPANVVSLNKPEVRIKITIEKDGSISNAKIEDDYIGGGCGEEIVRVVKSMPKWNPAEMLGLFVRSEFTISVGFESSEKFYYLK